RPLPNGTSDLVASGSRRNWMDAARGKHVPGGHLPDVLVTHESFHSVAVGIGANCARPQWRQPRLAQAIKQVGGVVARFIGVVAVVVPPEVVGRVLEKALQVG